MNTVKVDYMDDKLVQVWTLVWRVWGGITVIRYVVNLVRKANGCAGTSDSAPLPSGLLSEVPWHAGSPRPPRQPYPPSPLSLLPCRTPVPSPPPSAGPWVPQAPPAPFPLPSSPSPPHPPPLLPCRTLAPHPLTSSPPPSQDPGFRKHLLSEICKVGASIETALEGIPQDIEGVVAPDGAITVVQTRPQV